MMNDLVNRSIAIGRCWRALPKVNASTDIPKLIDFAFAHTIAPSQVRSELVQFAEIIAAAKPGRALEIGTCSGGTLFLLCRLAAPHATVISVDLPRGSYGAGYSVVRIPLYRRFARPSQSLHLVRADSHSRDTLNRVAVTLSGRKLDFLFIDGDHTYEGVKQDFELYSPLVEKGGTIAFHDIAPHRAGWSGGVPRFWNEIKGQCSYREIIADPKGGFGIGVLYI
jgi:predicted O-methyltransferase YrrM